MDVHVRIGDNRIFTLKQAVLLYQEGNRAFATLHEVKSRPNEAPYLCAGQSVTTGFLETLAKGLGRKHGSRGSTRTCVGQNAGADRMVEPGTIAADVFRRWRSEDQKLEWQDVSPSRARVHDPWEGVVRSRSCREPSAQR